MGAIADFCTRLVPAGTIICVVTKGKLHGKPTWFAHMATSPLDAEAKAMRGAQRLRDVYLAPAGFKQATPIGSGANKTARSFDNVHSLQALWLDIDVAHPAKKGPYFYPDNATALAAVDLFVAKAKLPKPQIVVSTGHGWHVHWLLDRPLNVVDWSTLAQALANAAIALELKADVAVTKNAIGLVRMPDTVNLKIPATPVVTKMHDGGAPPVPESAMRAALAPWMRASLQVVSRETSPNAALRSGVAFAPRPKSFAQLARKCNFITRSLLTGGVHDRYPAWRDVLSVMAACEDGEKFLHHVSKGYPTYTKEETERLWAGTPDSRPARCVSFHGHAKAVCEACPHWQKITSPIELGFVAPSSVGGAAQLLTPATPADDDLPPGFVRNEQGYISVVETDEKNNQLIVPVVEADVRDMRLVYAIGRDGVAHPQLRFRYVTNGGAGRNCAVFNYDVPTGNETAQAVGWLNFSISVKLYNVRKWSAFMLGSFERLLTKLGSNGGGDEVAHTFGWNSDRKAPTFTVAGFTYLPGGIGMESPGQDIPTGYTPAGSLAGWQAGIQPAMGKLSPELTLMMAAAFGGPLVELLGGSSLLINFTSRGTGTGKTTGMELSASVWGHPTSTMMSFSDTDNAVAKKVGIVRNLPVFWDELRSKDEASQTLEMIFRITQGREKARLNQAAKMQEIGTWRTALITAGNQSLADLASETTAGSASVARIFEVRVPRIESGHRAQGVMSEAQACSQHNYGTAGHVYARYLAANHARATKLTLGLHAHFAGQTRQPEIERFWIASAAILVAGAKLAGEAQILSFDLPTVMAAVEANLKYLRTTTVWDEATGDIGVDAIDGQTPDAATIALPPKTRAENSAVVLIERFLQAYQANILRTEFYMPTPGKPVPAIMLMEPQHGKAIEAHISQKPALLRIRQSTLKSFAVKQKFHWADVRQTLLPALGATTKFQTLGAGTKYVTTQTLVWNIPLEHEALRELAE